MKRRNFIKLSASASVVGLTPFELQAALKTFVALPTCPNLSNRKIVIINLAGGNDGLNTLIPINQYSTYASLRPTIGIPDGGINQYITLDTGLPENQQIGLHPALTGLKNIYDSGSLRIMQMVGYAKTNKSHFKSTDIVLTGNDGISDTNGKESGLMGRIMENHYQDLLFENYPIAVEIGSTKASLSFYGETNQGMALNITGQDASGFYSILSGLSGDAPANIPANTDYGTQLEYITNTDAVSNTYSQSISNAFNSGTNTGTYQDNDLSNQLKTVARLISGGLESKVYMVRISGFDTHNRQVDANGGIIGTHNDLLTQLSTGIESFVNDLKLQGIDEDVVGLTFSEFGRKARENGNLGTDHGEGTPMFIFGTPVAGGVSGVNPDLTEATSGNNYQIETKQFDYRQTFATLLQDFIGVDNSTIDSAFLNRIEGGAPISFTEMKVPEILTSPLDPSCYNILSTKDPSQENNKWLVYPNPVNDFVNLSSVDSVNSVSYKLYNSTGVLIMSNTSELVDGAATLNLSHLSSGLYIFELKVGSKKELHKIVKL